ncbi:hypothetical protein M440DRAFT_1451856 [Trichoderma longibrachiatum ATCC 18648]|uniref:Uncharacterized protein n=1 Tax=Trichoderma longibrachiatum ATCC 18648 TaxID=983965 RepID=A0A2T4BQB5_TRILO|nr:hypothetical protein M440DRAFT_1451856 [Trichoderma longibrachiatum ATCC 18648]
MASLPRCRCLSRQSAYLYLLIQGGRLKPEENKFSDGQELIKNFLALDRFPSQQAEYGPVRTVRMKSAKEHKVSWSWNYQGTKSDDLNLEHDTRWPMSLAGFLTRRAGGADARLPPGRCTSSKALTAVLIASPPYFGFPEPQIVEALSGLAAF